MGRFSMIKKTEKAFKFFKTGKFMRVNGKMTKSMDMGMKD